ncbi:MAG TPA: mechanosensitive ion channel domain-containing protein [Rubricoccaceae bacterium]
MQPDSLAAPPDTAALAPAAAVDSLARAVDTLAAAVAEAESAVETPGVVPDVDPVLPDSLVAVKRAAAAAADASEGLWAQVVKGVDGVIRLGRDLTGDVLLTLVVVTVLWALRTAALAAVRRRATDPRTLYRWRKGSGYAAVVIGVVLLLRVWVGALGSFATFFGLLSAGLAIALRDPLVNLAGWVYILWRRPFGPGDRVTVRLHTGDVTDQRVFGFTLLEVGTETGAAQSTGRIIHVPNGWVFSDSVVNHTSAFAYVWNEVSVTVPFESDWRAAKGILERVARDRAEEFSADAEATLRQAASEHFIFFSQLTPTVYTSVVEHGVQLTLRYLVPPRRVRGSEQAIWEDILDAFAASDTVDFAYRTQRVFRAPEEAKTGLGGPRGGEPVAPTHSDDPPT